MSFSRRWTPPVVTSLPDLTGCFTDMMDARKFCLRLESVARSSDHDYVLMDALETAALIRYCRCFTTGNRLRLNLQSGPALSVDEVKFHDRVSEIRSKHVAHPVNRFETQSVYVGMQVSPLGHVFATGVSSGSRSGLSLSSSDVAALKAMCEKWLIWLHEAINAECSRLLPMAQLMSGEQLLALPTGPIEPNSNPKIARSQGTSAF